MSPFRYDTYTNPYVGSIAAAMGRQGEIAAQSAEQIAAINARATEQRGQTLGQAIQQVAQIPTQVMEQNRAEKDAAQRRQLQQSQIDEYAQRVKGQQQEQQRAQQGQQLLGQLHQQYGDDFEKVASGLEDAGFGPEAEKYRQSGVAMQPYKDNIQKHVAIAVAGAIKDAKTPEQAQLNIDHLASGGPLGATISQQQRDGLFQTMQAAGPEGFDAWKNSTLDKADSIAGSETVKEGESKVGLASGRTLTSVAPKPTSESLKWDSYLASLGLPSGTPAEKLTLEQRAGFKAYSEPAGLSALHESTAWVTKAGLPVWTNEKGDMFASAEDAKVGKTLAPADVKHYQAPPQEQPTHQLVPEVDATGKQTGRFLGYNTRSNAWEPVKGEGPSATKAAPGAAQDANQTRMVKEAVDSLGQVDKSLDAVKDLVGPFEGRGQTVEQMIGDADPKIQAFGTKLLLAKFRVDHAATGTARAGSSPAILAKWDNLLSQKVTYDGLKSALQAAREILQGSGGSSGPATKKSADELIKQYGQ